MTHNGDTIVLDVRDYMDYGLEVYDSLSKKVGKVADFDRVTGYMLVRSHQPPAMDLHIPFSSITHIDPRDVFLSEATDTLRQKYHDPPPRTTLVERRTDPVTGEDDSRAFTSEPSGYDGAPTLVDEAAFAQMAHHIAPGYDVYTSEMEPVGQIKHFDRETGQMLVDRGGFSGHAFFVPTALIDVVDRSRRIVYLGVSSADLRRMHFDTSSQPIAKG